ncbi:MAG: 3-keto-5-aminohexanoate cleavage protein [Thermoleophilia bacterium]|nr:3-keto-5-aminohexanoate cleavage protein [Thermoleophilia bacterium]
MIITVAPTGAEVTREENPKVPYTPTEIAASACDAAQAGASLVHLHAREDDGTPSARPELFEEAIQKIRSGSDLITMVSTGGAVWMGIEDRTTGLEANPDVAGVETGSLNFGDEAFVTIRPHGLGIIDRATKAGIALEVEAFEVGHVHAAVQMVDSGEMPEPLRMNLVFGVPGGIDASPEALSAMLRPLPQGTPWSITCVGRHQDRMLALGLLFGATGIRVGFEDAVYMRRGVLAESNAELVRKAVTLVHSLGREVATPAQAREILGLPRAPSGSGVTT